MNDRVGHRVQLNVHLHVVLGEERHSHGRGVVQDKPNDSDHHDQVQGIFVLESVRLDLVVIEQVSQVSCKTETENNGSP